MESGFYWYSTGAHYLVCNCVRCFTVITTITPSFQTARAMMRLIREQTYRTDLNIQQLRLLSVNQPWASSDRMVVRQTFDALVFQSLDDLGLPRLALPVEYVAAAIVVFVHPVNYLVACTWSESHGSTTDEMAQGGEYDQFSARQLFAIVCNVYADSNGVGPATFQHKMDCKIRDAEAPLEEPSMEDDNDGYPSQQNR